MKIEILKNNHLIILNELSFWYWWRLHIIEQWFITNGWSIPRLLWSISHPLLYPFLIAYIIHDFMYSNKFKWIVIRKECDLFFLYNLCQTNKLIWILFYIWVRVWWRNNFKKDLPFEKDKTTIDKLKINDILN